MLLIYVAFLLSVKGPFFFGPNIDVVLLGERHEGVRVVGLAHTVKL